MVEIICNKDLNQFSECVEITSVGKELRFRCKGEMVDHTTTIVDSSESFSLDDHIRKKKFSKFILKKEEKNKDIDFHFFSTAQLQLLIAMTREFI